MKRENNNSPFFCALISGLVLSELCAISEDQQQVNRL